MKTIKILSLYLGSVIYFIFGDNPLLPILLTMVIIDYVTGFTKGIYLKELSSEIGFMGLLKKFFILTIVSVSCIIDYKVLNSGGVLSTTVTLFYIANEAISITENAIELGVPVPKKLKDILIQIKED